MEAGECLACSGGAFIETAAQKSFSTDEPSCPIPWQQMNDGVGKPQVGRTVSPTGLGIRRKLSGSGVQKGRHAKTGESSRQEEFIFFPLPAH